MVVTAALYLYSFDPDPTAKNTFWELVIGVFMTRLGIFGSNQVVIQRYCALPTLWKAKL